MLPMLPVLIFLGFGLAILGVGLLYLLWCMDADLVVLAMERFGKTPESRFARKVVWITGASSGIGEALALRLATTGAQLVLSARREKELEDVKKRCIDASFGKLTGGDVLVLPMDMCDLDSHKAKLGKVLDTFDKVDVLVNNAGRSQRALFPDIELSVDRDMFDLNVFSVLHLSRIVLPHFLGRNKGHFVVTSSVAGKIGVPGSASYNAAKHALHGYFDTLRVEHGQRNNIAVTMVCPGPFASGFLANAFTGKSGERYDRTMSASDLRWALSTRRCAELMAVAIANKLDEAWVCRQPVLALMYFHQYLPFLATRVMTRFGVTLTNKYRSHGRDDKKD